MPADLEPEMKDCASFPPFPSREAVLILVAILSLLTTKRECRIHNTFTHDAVIEVAVFFAGIFVTMIPALLILDARGAEPGVAKPWRFFLTISAPYFLPDNTPPEQAFFSMDVGLGLNGGMMVISNMKLMARGVGAVFIPLTIVITLIFFT